MRIAFVCADLGVPVFGSKGCSIHVQEVVRSLLKRGAQVDLFVARTGGPIPEEFSACSLHLFPVAATNNVADRELAARRVAEQIHCALLEHGPFDLVYERHSLWSSAGADYAHANGCPAMLEINAPLIREQQRHRDLVDSRAAANISQQVLDKSDSLIVVSDEVAQAMLSDFRIDPHKLHVIPNGVNLQRFAPAQRSCHRTGEFTVGFVGSLKPWHGVDSLLQAFQIVHAQHPNSRLIIVGDGPMLPVLRQQYCSAGSELASAVHWMGSVTSEQVSGYVNAMDVAVAPYPALSDFYFSPLKVYEYMACGVATVASAVGQLKSIITAEVDGFLYPPDEPGRLAEILITLAAQPARRRQVGQRARQRAVADFSWDQVVTRSLATVAPRLQSLPVPAVVKDLSCA